MFKTPEEYDANSRRDGKWFDKGTEHGTWNYEGGKTGIKRRLDDESVWVVEFESFEDLMAFVTKYGELVLSYGDGIIPSVEIYDYYRE